MKNTLQKLPFGGQAKDQLQIAAKSFFITWAMLRISSLHSLNIIAVFYFVMSWLLITQTRTIPKANIGLIRGLSCLLAGLYLLGSYQIVLADLTNLLFCVFILLVVALGLYLLLQNVLILLFDFCQKHHFSQIKLLPHRFHFKKDNTPRNYAFPILNFICCMGVWIFYFLCDFPGIMTPDSINQLEQVVGFIPYSNHHPWIHTLTIKVIYHLGNAVFGTPNAGAACFILCQMIFMALAASFAIAVLQRFTQNDLLLLLMILFYAFVPYNGVMAVTLWKDVLFAGCALLFTICIYLLLQEENVPIHIYLLTTISGILFGLYRSNGFYAILLFIPCLLILFRKQWKKIYPVFLAILAVILLVRGPIMDAFAVEQPDFAESISIPLQQVAAVIVNNGSVSEDDLEKIRLIMNINYIPQFYTPEISDNMKELLRAGNLNYLTQHKLEYLGVYIRIGLHNPLAYLNAYIQQTDGYYNPAAIYTSADTQGIIGNQVGVYTHPLLSGKIVLKLREILLKLYNIIPLYGILWSMGSVLFATLLCMGIALVRSPQTKVQKKTILLTYLPVLAVIATLMVATPVAREFRYAYSLFYTFPFLFGIAFTSGKEQE